MAEIRIESGVPLPKQRFKYPLKQMGVGDSIFVPGKTTGELSPSIANARRGSSKQFTSRTVEGGVRVWRTA